MKRLAAILMSLGILMLAGNLIASGPVGMYTVLEKVVFEPAEGNAERVQLWGAFSFIDGGISSGGRVSAPQRGYLYFTMPPDASEATRRAVRIEWADLKSLAGTGQAVAFGSWSYLGAFNPDGANHVTVTIQVGPSSYRGIELRVLDRTPPAMPPTPYITNTGLVKLAAEGSHAAIVKQLRDALRR